MGSKNRIFLGFFSSVILHFMRNIFIKNEIHITKNKYNKILEKHNEVKPLIIDNFQEVINNTFATCEYNQKGLYNFISIVEGKYIIYAISSNNYYVEVATLFYAKKRLLRKCFETIKFFNENNKSNLEKYLN